MARRTALLLVLAVSLLIALGLTMLASTSYFVEEGRGEEYFTLRKQIVYLVMAVGICVVFAMFDYNRLARWWWRILAVAAVLLAMVYIPNVGVRINGATRWIGLGFAGMESLRLQPSEFAKIALIIALAAWFARNEPDTKRFFRGFLVPSVMVGVLVVLIGCEVDLGNAALAALVGAGIMFVAGTRFRYLLVVAVTAASALAASIHLVPNRFERVMAFLHLELYRDTWGMQQWVSLIAFGSGGLWGEGIGAGRLKMSYLPEAHTDFIFPMVGEELGLAGTAGTVLMFVLIVIAGMCISSYAPNRFGKLLGFGLTFLLSMEALLNMGVTTALLPNKGLPMPFVSYGGSSLLAAMIAVGILINIHRQGVHVTRDQLPVIRKKQRWTPQL